MPLPPAAETCLREWIGDQWTATPLAGDASVRAYYRIASGEKTWILTWYPPEVQSQARRFLAAYEAVSPHARVPEVLCHDDAAVLQRDAGKRTLFDVLHQDREEGLRLYRASIDLLIAFQKAPDTGINPPFSAEFFFGELEMAREFYIEQLMGVDATALRPYMKMLSENIARLPYVLCHRDFHGQNIHVDNDELYLIDYQDLRMGPDTYDMASLLRDRGVARILGEETELELLEEYHRRTGAEGNVRHRYFETLLQRAIKILGTYSKQPITRGKMHYLDFIPPTLESIARCLDELPEYASLRDIFPLQFSLGAAHSRARELNNANRSKNG